tara:strand:- start:462 stop:692 length:231 start_codon:yes stop_codon:yes gene_type:complete
MPTYTFINKETREEEEVFCTLAEREEKLKSGKYEQKIISPKFITQHGSTLSKTSDGWKDVLKSIKKGSSKDNKINV